MYMLVFVYMYVSAYISVYVFWALTVCQVLSWETWKNRKDQVPCPHEADIDLWELSIQLKDCFDIEIFWP